MTPGLDRVLAVIPSRFASSRLPGKPLKQIAGKTMVRRVWEQACKARLLSQVVVATDSDAIAEEIRALGGDALMTDEALTTGSARVAVCAEELAKRAGSSAAEYWDLIVNIQGDMPFVPPQLIDAAVAFMQSAPERFDVGTIATPLTDEAQFNSPSVVKVVVDRLSRALYFSRAPIPHSRDGRRLEMPDGSGRVCHGFKHLGLYLFRPQALLRFIALPTSELEDIEKLEQLRILDAGGSIGVLILEPELTAGLVEVDTPEDLQRAEMFAVVGS